MQFVLCDSLGLLGSQDTNLVFGFPVGNLASDLVLFAELSLLGEHLFRQVGGQPVLRFFDGNFELRSNERFLQSDTAIIERGKLLPGRDRGALADGDIRNHTALVRGHIDRINQHDHHLIDNQWWFRYRVTADAKRK